MVKTLREAVHPNICPWCGESNRAHATSQIEAVGKDSWYCNTCGHVFRVLV